MDLDGIFEGLGVGSAVVGTCRLFLLSYLAMGSALLKLSSCTM